MKEKKGFFKNFTWVKFIYFIASFFVLTLVIEILWNFFDKSASIKDLFTLSSLFHRFCLSVITGFVFTLFVIPAKKVSST
jgi:hypothetical protein